MTISDDDLLLLNAYHDAELSPSETIAMERRLAAEPELRATADHLHRLSTALSGALVTEPASEALRARIVDAVGFVDVAPARLSRWSSWQSMAAALALGFIIGGMAVGGAMYRPATSDRSGIADAVLAGHLRSLVAPQPFDIASSDRHVVKPWFNGRTTIAPTAPDLASKGFPLIGGRIDVVDGKAVPSLVYRHDRHLISVTVTEAPADTVPDDSRNRDGSTIVRWSARDLMYWAVSDLNTNDLGAFVDLFKAATTQGG